MPRETCNYEITSEELPAGFDGWSCGREVWTDIDPDTLRRELLKFPTKCIWHAEQAGKPTDELIAALKADWERDMETEPWARRLDGAFLLRVDFPSSYQIGVPLKDFTLIGAYLRFADLLGADLEGAHLEGAKLEGAHLRAHLEGAHLEGAKLEGADLSGADLTGADLNRADLEGAHLEGADLRDTHLEGAKLTEADLSGADLTYANLDGADLEDAIFDRADLRYATLTDARWHQARLSDIRINDETDFGVRSIYEHAARDPERKAQTELKYEDTVDLWQQAAWAYDRLDRLFRDNAMSQQARTWHFKRAEAERRRHRAAVHSALRTGAEQSSAEEEAAEEESSSPSIESDNGPNRTSLQQSRQAGSHLFEFLVATGHRVLTGYGNRFKPIIAWIFVTILGSALLYVWFGLVIQGSEGATVVTDRSWDGVITALQFSIGTFGFGGTGRIEAVGYSRIVVIIESMLGGFLFGLFGFVLARRLP